MESPYDKVIEKVSHEKAKESLAKANSFVEAIHAYLRNLYPDF